MKKNNRYCCCDLGDYFRDNDAVVVDDLTELMQHKPSPRKSDRVAVNYLEMNNKQSKCYVY